LPIVGASIDVPSLDTVRLYVSASRVSLRVIAVGLAVAAFALALALGARNPNDTVTPALPVLAAPLVTLWIAVRRHGPSRQAVWALATTVGVMAALIAVWFYVGSFSGPPSRRARAASL
jgi:hypothetical protein